MSRTMKLPVFAGACALALLAGSGALARGGGAAGVSMSSHATLPSPIGSRLSTAPRMPTVGAGDMTLRTRPLTGTRLPANDVATVRSRAKVPSDGTATPITVSNGVHVDPPPPR